MLAAPIIAVFDNFIGHSPAKPLIGTNAGSFPYHAVNRVFLFVPRPPKKGLLARLEFTGVLDSEFIEPPARLTGPLSHVRLPWRGWRRQKVRFLFALSKSRAVRFGLS